MLGENHSLLSEFPEMKDAIMDRVKTDEVFANDMARYDELDKEIRKLELNGSPIDDGEMHQLKHDRAAMKDSLHQRLVG